MRSYMFAHITSMGTRIYGAVAMEYFVPILDLVPYRKGVF
jgi:hypothetical protein